VHDAENVKFRYSTHIFKCKHLCKCLGKILSLYVVWLVLWNLGIIPKFSSVGIVNIIWKNVNTLRSMVGALKFRYNTHIFECRHWWKCFGKMWSLYAMRTVRGGWGLRNLGIWPIFSSVGFVECVSAECGYLTLCGGGAIRGGSGGRSPPAGGLRGGRSPPPCVRPFRPYGLFVQCLCVRPFRPYNRKRTCTAFSSIWP